MKPVSYLAMLFLYAACFACFDPQSKFYSGAIFNNNETVDLTPLMGMGTEDVNYFSLCKPEAGIGDSIRVIGAKQDLSGKSFDAFTIDTVMVAGNTLTVRVTYGGGCTAHDFVLYTMPPVVEKDACRSDLYLSHNANGDNCKALITATLRFDLAPLSNGKVPEVVSLFIRPDTAASAALSRQVKWTPAMNCTVIYRGHYGANTLVYLGAYAPLYQPAEAVPRIVVCLDTTKVPTPAEKALAVATELRWLVSQKIMVLTEERIAGIQAALAVNGDQYWSMQDTTLAYNMWFSYDTIKGVWGTGANAIYGVKGGCGAGIVYSLPHDQLVPPSASARQVVSKKSGAAGLSGPQSALYDLKGRKIDSRNLRRGVHIIAGKNGAKLLFKPGAW